MALLPPPPSLFLPPPPPAVMYSEQVPVGGPPSFSGRLVKYTYKLAVGAQKPGCAAQITRIPFHIMTIPGEGRADISLQPSSPISLPPPLSSSLSSSPLSLGLFSPSETLYKKDIVPSPKNTNPFLTSEVKEDPTPDIALQALAMETSKRTSSE